MSHPVWAKNPAHSKATYEAPTTKVFPGDFSSQNRSSLVIAYSLAPFIASTFGLPPTAITKALDLTILSGFPFNYSINCGKLLKLFGYQ